MDPSEAFERELNNVEESAINKMDDKLARAIKYLSYHFDEPSKTFDDLTCYNAFVYVVKAAHHLNLNYDLFLCANFDEYIANLYAYFYEIRNSLNLNVKIDPHDAEKVTNLNEKHVTILGYLLYLTVILVGRNKEFCIKFLNNGLKVFMKCLNDDEFLMKNKFSKVNDLTQNPFYLLDYIVLNIAHLSMKTSDEYKHVWVKLDSVNILLKVSNFKETTLFIVYTIISHIATDEQINNLAEIHSIVDTITKLLLRCRNDFRYDKFDRLKKHIHFNENNFECDVHTIRDENLVTTSMVSLLQGVYKLACNEKMKNDLYFRRYISSCLKAFLKKGNYIEKYFTLEVLAQLSFSESVSQDLARNTKVNKRLKRLLKQIPVDEENVIDFEFYKNIKLVIEQIKWNLNDRNFLDEKTYESKHLLISHDFGCREICLRLKEKLEKSDFKVWVDMNKQADLDFNSNIKAIEKCSCFLMCVTERYRQSIICQIQAQYAFKLNKRIIPLIMQVSYEKDMIASGWLEPLIKNTIYIDFTNQDLEQSVFYLKGTLNSFIEREKDYDAMSTSNVSTKLVFNTAYIRDETNTTLSTYSLIEEWSEKEVREWFVRNRINLLIFDYLKPQTGEILNQLHEMKNTSTEFYYSSLREIKDISFPDIVLFSSCLSKLFKDKS